MSTGQTERKRLFFMMPNNRRTQRNCLFRCFEEQTDCLVIILQSDVPICKTVPTSISNREKSSGMSPVSVVPIRCNQPPAFQRFEHPIDPGNIWGSIDKLLKCTHLTCQFVTVERSLCENRQYRRLNQFVQRRSHTRVMHRCFFTLFRFWHRNIIPKLLPLLTNQEKTIILEHVQYL